MFAGFDGVGKKVSKVEYNEFTGRYDKESILNRLAVSEGTTMGDIVTYALNEMDIDLAELKNINFTESQAKEVASLLSDIHLALDVEDMEGARSTASELAKYITSLITV